MPPRCPHFAALHGALRLGAIDLAQPQLDLDEPRSEHRIECRSLQPRSLLLGTWLGVSSQGKGKGQGRGRGWSRGQG